VGKITFDAKLGRELFMLGILGPIVKRNGLTTLCRELLEAVNDRPIRFSSPFSGKLCKQN
jgi:hypothetical protein